MTGIFGSQTSSPARWSDRWRSGPDRPFVCVAVAGCKGTTAAVSLQSRNKHLFLNTKSKTNVYIWHDNPTEMPTPCCCSLQIYLRISVCYGFLDFRLVCCRRSWQSRLWPNIRFMCFLLCGLIIGMQEFQFTSAAFTHAHTRFPFKMTSKKSDVKFLRATGPPPPNYLTNF